MLVEKLEMQRLELAVLLGITFFMRYRHISIFYAHGLHVKEGEPTQVVIDTPDLQVFFAHNVDDYATDIIRRTAIANTMLNWMFRGGDEGKTFEQAVVSQMEALQEKQKQCTKGHFLVFEHRGYVEGFYTDEKSEFDDYIIYQDGIDRSVILEGKHKKFVAATMSIVLETGAVIGLEKLNEASVFYGDNGKPAYSMKLEASGEGNVSKEIDTHERDGIANRYPQLLEQESLQRVVRLLVSSLDRQMDKLRAFLSAWSALEIFTNKVFKLYEKELFEELQEGDKPGVWKVYPDRVCDVMKDKYRLTDKFGVIAMHLAPNEADPDLQTFRNSKDLRDSISHGSEVDEKALPVAYTQHLIKKYLRLYLDR